MKKWLKISSVIVIAGLLWWVAVTTSSAQSPNRFSYQALIRNAANVVLVNQSVGMRVSILQGSAAGASVYTETLTASTNAGGIVSLEIGSGIPVSGNFVTIDWSNGPYFIKTETDPSGGTSYSISGTLQLMSVPYAMYSNKGNFNDLENKPVIDGSETKVTAGASIAVTGTGTTGTPYMINFGTQSMTRDQRIALAAPYAGQIIWCNNCGSPGELQVFNGTTWTNWCGGAASAAMATVSTTAASAIAAYTATSGGNITSDGGSAVTSRGVCWSTSPNPTVSDPRTNDGPGSGSFSSSITGLLPLTTYYVRAYTVNGIGTAYGTQISFTTTATVPTLATDAASSITTNSATSGGNITSDGGSAVTARGVCWNTSPNPTTANSTTTNGSGTGTFTSSLTGLSVGTTYYVRAYATNGIGTAYGNEISFTTVSLAIVTTRTPDNIISTQARLGGDVTNDGGGTVTENGICWSTSVNPTTSTNKVIMGSGTGAYFATVNPPFTKGTIYHVRAYAINSAGTSYGSDIAFIALAIGDSWGGGKVAYIDASLIHGFIDSGSDQVGGTTWGCSGTDLAGAAGSTIGTGNQNTLDIEAGCATIGTPADICANLVTGGYSDWYLPSQDELWQIYFNRVAIGGFGVINYWSSTEIDALNAIRVRFDSGTITSILKNTMCSVRAIRAF
jgi:hypothetical protein